MNRVLVITIALLACGMGSSARAQGIDGYVSAMVDVVPNVTPRATELRSRLFAERKLDLGSRARITASGFVETLLGDRRPGGTSLAAIVRPTELHAELFWSKADLRVGMGRVVWGRLDEFLPTDVVNPLDFTKFFLEGRVEARLAVPLIRGRFLPGDRFSVEAVYVPVFRRGRFDELEEDTAPFNLAPPIGRISHEPAHTWSNAQGGVRTSVTTGRVDWSVSAYRGFEPLPVYELAGVQVTERFPRFTMIGGDFETVRGQWGLRGEVAAFVDRTIQAPNEPAAMEGQSTEVGVGLDRRAGDYRISTNVVFSRTVADAFAALKDSDTTIVASVDRSFARETRLVRTFAAFNPGDRSVFARVIASFNLRDNVSAEASGGMFDGRGTDASSSLSDRDFFYLRLKVFF